MASPTPARILPFHTKQWLARERAAKRRDELLAEVRLLQDFLGPDALDEPGAPGDLAAQAQLKRQ